MLLVAWICKNNSQSPWHNFLLATTLSQIFYIVRESSFTPYLAFGLAAILLTSKIPHFLFPKAPPKLSMKEGSLFCFVVMRSNEPECFRSCSWCLGKGLDEEGCMGFGSMTFGLCGAKVLEYWMISSLKIKLYRTWKFWRNWNVPLVLLERSWWVGFNGIYLVRFGFRIVGDIDLKVISTDENTNSSKKPGFGKKNQLRKW